MNAFWILFIAQTIFVFAVAHAIGAQKGREEGRFAEYEHWKQKYPSDAEERPDFRR